MANAEADAVDVEEIDQTDEDSVASDDDKNHLDEESELND